LLFGDTAAVSFAVRAQFIGSALLMSASTATRVTALAHDSSALRAAGRAGLPMLAMYGTVDKLGDLAACNALYNQDFSNLDSKLELKGTGHAIMQERPAEVNTAILRFARKVFGY
jgi:pimeloyl-ACP methyl ester carboxylesterase